ncbi:hypothetical protein IAT40_007253 [Kwoniella sp. CBS 6097]
MCACANISQHREKVRQCEKYSLFVYQHEAGDSGAPSAWVKRQAKERLARDMGEINVHCPAGLTACKVDGADHLSFECIDTDEEIESCGGCLHGSFNSRALTSPHADSRGTNCLTLPGVSPAGVTCDHGQCKTYACEEGYKLVGHSCTVS